MVPALDQCASHGICTSRGALAYRVQVLHGARCLILLAASFMLPACGEAPPQLTGDALSQRHLETKALAKKHLLRAELAFLGREALVIKDKQLIDAAVARIMTNLETWMAGDEARLHSFLEVEVRSACKELITSPEGIRALNQLAKIAFENPNVTNHQVQNPEREPTELEKHAAKAFGTLLSGRPAEARGLPATEWTEIIADFGLVPSPLEKNPPNQNSGTLLRHHMEASDEWLDAKQPERPAVAVIENAARRVLLQHPSASNYVMKMRVLRTLGAPVEWEFFIQRDDTNNEVLCTGIGKAPGYQTEFRSHQFRLSNVAP